MLDELDDNKLREAAEHYQPEYDNNAWDKMRLKLDAELPKKDKKILWLLLILFFTASGIYFAVLHQNFNKRITTANLIQQKTVNKNQPKTDIQKHNAVVHQNTSTNATVAKFSIKKIFPLKQNFSATETSIKNSNPAISITFSEKNNKEQDNSQGNILQNENETSLDSSIHNQDNILNKPQMSSATTNNLHQNNKANDSVTQAVAAAKVTINRKRNLLNNTGVSVSTGLDVSGVDVHDAGKVTVPYGAGVVYTLSPKLSVRSGFYKFDKIYSANGNKYHLSNYPTNESLEKVDANCNVVEVPLNIVYKLNKSKNNDWFASAGLASYFMKKEAYEYYYKTNAGERYAINKTITNKNKNYFSILTLSTGYKHTINKQFSLTAEPYVNLPLNGVGEGKIHLSSAGLLFTLTVFPFHNVHK